MIIEHFVICAMPWTGAIFKYEFFGVFWMESELFRDRKESSWTFFIRK